MEYEARATHYNNGFTKIMDILEFGKLKERSIYVMNPVWYLYLTIHYDENEKIFGFHRYYNHRQEYLLIQENGYFKDELRDDPLYFQCQEYVNNGDHYIHLYTYGIDEHGKFVKISDEHVKNGRIYRVNNFIYNKSLPQCIYS
jgi:hypothetical protein